MRMSNVVYAVILGTLMGTAQAASIVNNGSFEGGADVKAPKWEGKGGFWKGQGTCAITDKDASEGKKSLQFVATKPKSQGQSSSGAFQLIPDQKYRVAYSMKRCNDEVFGRLSLEFSVNKKSGAFVCYAKGKAKNVWQRAEGTDMSILFFLPPGSKRQYIGLNDGIFSIPSDIYGKEPVQCRGKLYVQGMGELFFDNIVIEKLEEGK